ncbi:MAG: alpha/beta hydrolase [Patescibacteria group bacterium]
MPRIIIIHGWSSGPQKEWFPWLERELKAKGFDVEIPAMPNPKVPQIGPWVGCLSQVVGTPDEEIILVGHSVGCQTILRYLETIDVKIRGAVFVAGWFTLKLDDFDEAEIAIAKPWLETPIDFEKVKNNLNKSMAIFSDDDYFVPLADAELFRERLGSSIITLNQKGHISGLDGVTELPEALEAIKLL